MVPGGFSECLASMAQQGQSWAEGERNGVIRFQRTDSYGQLPCVGDKRRTKPRTHDFEISRAILHKSFFFKEIINFETGAGFFCLLFPIQIGPVS